MMKIKMLIGMAGARFSVAPREITDRFSDAEAQDLIDAGYAEEAPDETPQKTAEEWAAELAALIDQADGAKIELAALAEKLTAADTRLVEGEAREKLLADAVDAAKLDAAALAEKLTQAEGERDNAMQQLKAIQANQATATDAGAAKPRVAKETAVKAPPAEKRD